MTGGLEDWSIGALEEKILISNFAGKISICKIAGGLEDKN